MENLLFQPETLIERVKYISGHEILSQVPNSVKEELSQEISHEWTSDWDEGDGFGSSDFTFALKEFVDSLLMYSKLPYETTFKPYLSIVKKS